MSLKVTSFDSTFPSKFLDEPHFNDRILKNLNATGRWYDPRPPTSTSITPSGSP